MRRHISEGSKLAATLVAKRDISFFGVGKLSMDKKAKKRLDIVRKRLQKLRLQLSGARTQDDEPGEVERLESEIATLEQEAEKLKSS